MGSAGKDVVELAASCGLHLLGWQCDVLEDGLAERLDHNWVAGEVGLDVPRQNGKGSVLEALCLAGLFLWDYRQIIYSAHEYKTAIVFHRRLEQLIRNSWLHDEYVGENGYPKGGGNRGIVLLDGRRLDISARTRGASRGFTGDLVIFDEAYNLSEDAMAAMAPTLLTNPETQVWYASSAPYADSAVFHSVRKRALEADDRLAYFEWGNEPGADPLDWDARARANPSLGTLITDGAIEDLYRRLGSSPGKFEVECLGIPEMPDGGANIFGAGKWQACLDSHSQIQDPDRAKLALDVAPDSSAASFSVAGTRADGLHHVELIDRGEGTGWVVRLALEYKPFWPIHVLPAPHPVSGLLDDLKNAGVEVVELPAGAWPQACAALQYEVVNGTLRQLGQGPLDSAVNGAAVRTVGEGWSFARATSSVDISPLVACTVALWAATQAQPGMWSY